MATLQQQLNTLKAQYIENYHASKALDADIDIPAPKDLQYLPYQRAGIAYATKNNGILLADEPGLGKTIQAIGLINYDTSINSALIICPASLKVNWLQEIYKWLVRPLTVSIAQGTFPPTNIIIVNYDVIEHYIEAIHARTFDMIVVDEAHVLRNADSVKTSLILGNKEKNIPCIQARKRMLLTGTPIVNRPAELWPLISYLNPSAWQSWEKFAERFCRHEGKKKNPKPNSGASELNDLQRLLRASVMIRRMKAEVLYQLPKKMRRIFKVTDECAKAFLNEEKRVYEVHEQALSTLKAAVLVARDFKNYDKQTYITAIKNFKEGRRIALAEYSRMRHTAAQIKLPHVIKHINTILQNEPNKKLILFAHHSDIIDTLVSAFRGQCVCVRGSTPNKERQLSVKRFQEDPSCTIFIGSILAACTGFTLTASHHVIFAEISYISADLSQAEDRAYRIGQRYDVLVDHVLLDESIEVKMAQLVIEKQRIAEEALDYKH